MPSRQCDVGGCYQHANHEVKSTLSEVPRSLWYCEDHLKWALEKFPDLEVVDDAS